MNIPIFVSILFGLQLFYWLTGRRASRNLQGKEDYFLAGKNVQFFPLMMTFLATQVGGGMILGSAEESYRFGWAVLLYPMGVALGLILLGSGIGRRLAGFQASTVSEIMEQVYGSVLLKKITSVLSVISLFMVLVAQIIASNKFLVSLGLENTSLFILFWSIVIIYTAQGGLRAVISTDMVQAAFFSGVLLLAFGLVLWMQPSTSSLSMPQFESFGRVSSSWCGWLLMPLLMMVIEQDMAQRCFAGASPKVVSKASLWAGVMAMGVGFIPVFLGCLASSAGMEISPGGSVLMATIAKMTNPWITALVGCAVLAAIVSTATSLINAISSNLSSDFKLAFVQKIDPMKIAKGITCLISIAAVFFAFYFDNVVGMLIQSYELSVSCLFVPVFMALFNKKGHFWTALLAIACGGIGFFLFRIFPVPFPKEIASIGLSLAGYGCGKALSDYRNRKTILRM